MKRSTLTATLVVIILILAAGIYAVYAHKNGTSLFGQSIEKDNSSVSDYSAVFLTNGQVYFGKITARTSNEIDLTDIYYLQVNQQVQPDQSSAKATPTPSSQPEVSLVKLGNELHGPNDKMRINLQQVLFTESLKTDSKVVKAIQADKSK
jgi:hypothetical protein